jgi:hypothetical protein
MYLSKKLVGLVVVVVAVVAASAAFATIPDAGGVIHGCFAKSGGTLRVIDATVTNCKATEMSLNWSQTGPQGVPGPQGLKGDTGPTGDTGPQGPKGDTGSGVLKTIGGLVSDTGTLQVGSGVTAAKAGPGDYTLTFPDGTWQSIPVIQVTPFGLPGFFPAAEIGSLVVNGSGGAVAHILITKTAGTFAPGDASFWFTATAS